MILIREMKRRLFNLGAVVSLGMMLAIVVLWVRSYWRADAVWLQLASREIDMGSQCGVLWVQTHPTNKQAKIEFTSEKIPSFGEAKPWYPGPDLFLGFAFERYPAPGIQFSQFAFPHWSLMLLTATIPTIYAL